MRTTGDPGLAGKGTGPVTLYGLLSVERDASAEEIKLAYRQTARAVHPDANPHDPTAHHRFHEVVDAYEILADPERRADYDATLPPPEDRNDPDRPARPRPPELPLLVANLLTKLLVVLPVVWAAVGFPGARGRTYDDVTEWQRVFALTFGAVVWLVAGTILWSRSPTVDEHVPRWRSPGWDGTALVVRLAVLWLLVGVTTAVLLGPQLAGQRAPTWRTSAWLAVILAAWIVSGRVPRWLGYRSRHDRYWDPDETPGLDRRSAHPILRRAAHRGIWEGFVRRKAGRIMAHLRSDRSRPLRP